MYLRLCLFAALCAPFSPTPVLAAASMPGLSIEDARAFSEQVDRWQQAHDARWLHALRKSSVMTIALLKRNPEVRLRLEGEQLRAFMERALDESENEQDDDTDGGPTHCEFEAAPEGQVIETCSQSSADSKALVWSKTIFARDDKGPYLAWMLLTDSPQLLQTPAPKPPADPSAPQAHPSDDDFDNSKA